MHSNPVIEAARSVYEPYSTARHSPARLLELICADRGIAVEDYAVRNSQFAGMLWLDEGRPVIMFHSALPRSRRLFTIAHELGHFFLHRYLEPHFFCTVLFRPNSRPREREANLFAAELLMPQSLLRLYTAENLSTRTIAKLLGLSEEAVRYRLRDLS